MRNYIRILKSLDHVNVLRTPLDNIEGVPEEVLRLLRLEHGVAFSVVPDWVHFWIIEQNVRDILRSMEQFSGNYRVGKDEIGYFWEDIE